TPPAGGSSSNALCHVHVLVELRRDVLLCGLEDLNQLLGKLEVVWGKETESNTLCSSSSSSADTMNIVLKAGWEIVVDDTFDIFDVCGRGESEAVPNRWWKEETVQERKIRGKRI